jgi:hypothetical protein
MTNPKPEKKSPHPSSRHGAVELISTPLRIAILITLMITLGGVAWSCLARIPIYVNGVAYLLRLGNIGALQALTDGQIHYQFSASVLIRKPLFQRLYQLSKDADSINDQQALATTRELLAMRPGGPRLDVNALYSGQVPEGQVLAWIDSPLNRSALEQTLLNYDQSSRELVSQRIVLKRINNKIGAKISILKKQLSSETEYLNSIRSLLSTGYASKANVLSQEAKVNSIEADILSQQEQIATNGQKDMEAETDLQKAMVNLRTELNDFISRSFIFATSPLYIVDINSPQASQVNNLDTVLHISTQQLSRLPDRIPGYLSQSDAEQISRGMPLLVTPVGLDRAQFGGIVGTVVDVNRLPSNLYQVAERIGSLAIAQEVTALIPDPVRVDIALQRDRKDREPNHGGYRWSSPGSPPFALAPGNQLTLQITAQRVRPISLLFPFLMRLTGESPPTMPLKPRRTPAAARTTTSP